MYFNEHVEGFYRSEDSESEGGWDFYSNPLDVYHTKSREEYWDYHSKEHVDLINNNLTLHATERDYKCWKRYYFGVIRVGILNGIFYNENRVK